MTETHHPLPMGHMTMTDDLTDTRDNLEAEGGDGDTGKSIPHIQCKVSISGVVQLPRR